jgi:AcrR family transcriptional regulator
VTSEAQEGKHSSGAPALLPYREELRESTLSPVAGQTERSTRQRLIEAAAQLISEQGYERVGVLAVARRAGLTNGAIYGNFRDKAHLLAAAIEMKLHRLFDAVERGRRVPIPPQEMLVRLARGLGLDTPLADRRLLIEAYSAAWRDPTVGVLVRERLDRIETEVTRLAEQAREEGTLADDVDPATLARFGSAIALGYHLITTAGVREPDRDAWIRLATRVVLCMVKEQPGPRAEALEAADRQD